MNRSHPVHDISTPEGEGNFLSIFVQRDRNIAWGACLAPLESDRSDLQNALMWSWNGVIAKSDGHNNPNWTHGETKMRLLLPLYKTWGGKFLARAKFIEDVLMCVPKNKHKVFYCYDSVRTSKGYLSIKRMAEYLTVMQRDAAERGIILESNDDLEFKSQAQGVV